MKCKHTFIFFKKQYKKGQFEHSLTFTIVRRLSIDLFPLGTRWRHQMETFSASLAICAGNSPVPGEFPAQRPVTRGFDVFFDLRLNKRLSKQSWCWWFETLSRPLWRHCNESVARCYSMFYIWCVAMKYPQGLSKMQESCVSHSGLDYYTVLGWGY